MDRDIRAPCLQIAEGGLGNFVLKVLGTAVNHVFPLYLERKLYPEIVEYLIKRANWEFKIDDFSEQATQAMIFDGQFDLIKKLWIAKMGHQRRQLLLAQRHLAKSEGEISENVFIQQDISSIPRRTEVLSDTFRRFKEIMRNAPLEG